MTSGPGDERMQPQGMDDATAGERETVYDGRIVKLGIETVRFPNGELGTLEVVRHPGASAVIPFLDPPTDPDPRILLLRQYRYAAGGHIYEVPAGLPDSPDESWEACARRELMEETGHEAGGLTYLGRILTTPGFTDEVIHLFVATGLRAGDARRDADEFIELVPLPFSQAVRGVERGEIVDAKTVCALLFAASFPGALESSDRRAPTRPAGGSGV